MSEDGAPARAGAVIAGGIGWKLTAQLVTQVTRAGVAIILARLLTPFEFGVAALALVFTALVLVFTDLGAALVQGREQTEEDRSTAFWISLGMGAVVCGLGIALARPIAIFFDEPQVEELFTVLSLSFLLTAAATTQSALLHRSLAFRRVELANMIAVLGGGATGLTVAFAGGGAWAIVLQQIAYSVVYCVLLWGASPWRPRRIFSTRSARTILGFSINLTGANLLSYLQKNLDNILIGRFLGAAPLGIYAISYNLMLYPVTRVAEPIYEALFPVFSRMQGENERVAEIWLRVVRLLAAIVVPSMVVLIVAAPEFVGVVLGHRWDAAVPVIQLLASSGIVYALNTVTRSVVLAKGLTGLLFRYTLLSAVVLLSAIGVGLNFGIKGVAAGISIAVALMWPIFVWVASRELGVPGDRYWRNLVPTALCAAGTAAALVPLRLFLNSRGIAEPLVLVACLAAAAAVYGALCAVVAPALKSDTREIIAVIRRRSRPASPPHPEPIPPAEESPAR